ncbi:MAG: UDP-N-acetylmuramate--L-alanine ligase [Clostridiales bacterium]|nr:UDP-N-acetylmuramate--L-alanine ligase [Clostridiales bacterium]
MTDIRLSDYKNIHCIGIGGVGVSAIASILLARGDRVSGSDMNENEIIKHLRKEGAIIYPDHRRENVEGADLIIYSAAIADENPELVRARELGIPMYTRAEILGVLMKEFKDSIAISGTHGKTTTTSMVSLILEKAGLDPTILVGGTLREIGGNVKVGRSQYFVTEACEYRDSFLELKPRIEVILNIDSDHMDYFKDIEHIVRSFKAFTRQVPENGMIIAYDANPFVNQVLEDIPNAITYGYAQGSTYSIRDVKFTKDGMPNFHIFKDGENLGEMQLSMPGEHNILNATAAFACCHELGVPPETIIKNMRGFTGTQRRFDIKGLTGKDVKIIDDYAHHPTEIKATLEAATKIPHGRTWTIFQPHTYTRTLALFDEFANAFEKTDVLILTDIYAAREKNIYKVSSDKLAERIRTTHPDKDVRYIKEFQEIADTVCREAEPGDLVITMGAGDVFKIGNMILK